MPVIPGISLTYTWQIRYDTAAEWTAANPTLLLGEMGYESDTGRLKIGDAVGAPPVGTAWNDLPYFAGGGAQTPWSVMTTAEMNAIPTPTEGMAVWNTTEHQLMVYDGSAWVGVAMTL
jgi:hypothetical protein